MRRFLLHQAAAPLAKMEVNRLGDLVDKIATGAEQFKADYCEDAGDGSVNFFQKDACVLGGRRLVANWKKEDFEALRGLNLNRLLDAWLPDA